MYSKRNCPFITIYYLFFSSDGRMESSSHWFEKSIFPNCRSVKSFYLDYLLLHRPFFFSFFFFLLCNLCNRLYIYFWKYNTISIEMSKFEFVYASVFSSRLKVVLIKHYFHIGACVTVEWSIHKHIEFVGKRQSCRINIPCVCVCTICEHPLWPSLG